MELSILVLAFAGLRPADLAKCRQYSAAAPDVPSSVQTRTRAAAG
jgi:hypothetical protein